MSKRGAQTVRSLILCALMVLIAALICASVLADDIKVITYGNSTSLTRNQDLEYLTCMDQPQTLAFTQLVCAQTYATIAVSADRVSDKCYYSQVDLSKYNCDQYTIESYYTNAAGDHKITQAIGTNTVLVAPTFILSAQSWDGGWGTASNTAYSIWVLSKFGDVYRTQIDDGMNWLKDNRRNEPKCWVDNSGQCSPRETIMALAYLKLANITEGNRIVNDGLAYVETLQKYIGGTTWSAQIEALNDNTYCNLTVAGGSLVSNALINDSQTITAGFTAAYGTVLNMSCSNDVILSINDDRGVEKFSYRFNQGSATNFDDGLLASNPNSNNSQFNIVRLQQPCWSASTALWSPCDSETTAYALSLGIASSQQTDGKTWMTAALQNHSVIGKFIASPWPQRDSAFYLMTVDPGNADIRNWLIYSQNNDGSFGSGDMIVKIQSTAAAYLALMQQNFTQKGEVLADAAHWMSQAYTGTSYSDVKTDGSMFQILSLNAQPYLRSLTPGVVVLHNDLTGTASFKPFGLRKISNVTTQVFTVDGTSADLVSVNAPANVFGNDTFDITLQSKTNSAGNTSGYVRLLGIVDNDTSLRELRRIYFTSQRDAAFDISPNEQMYNAYDGKFSYEFNVAAVNLPVSCNVQMLSTQFEADQRLDVSKPGPVHVAISVPGILSGEVNGTGKLTCDKAGTIISVPFKISVFVHNKMPLEVSPAQISVTGYTSSFSIKVKNLETVPMDLSVKVITPTEHFMMEPVSSPVPPGKTVTVQFDTTFKKPDNVSDTNIIEVTGFDKTVDVPVSIAVSYKPTTIGFIIFFALIITLVATAGYIIYNWKDYKPQFVQLYTKTISSVSGLFHKKGAPGSASGMGTSMKKKDVARATMLDIISIMQSMDKSEQEITAKLEAEGYAKPLIAGLIDELKSVQLQVSNIKHEDTVLGIIKGLDAEMDVIGKVLKDKGYNENDIREAFKELSTDTDSKEKKLRAEAGFSDTEKIT